MNCDATRSAVVSYAARGWQPHQIHGLRADGRTCTCRRAAACAGSTGKHPVDTGWQDRARTVDEVLADYGRRPWATNIGIVTGKVSGLFVLDVDPGNGGGVTLAALVAEHGPLPDTYRVRTGSGGAHYYFRLPEWRLGNSAGRLGVGLDIRSDGGQVVAPPSISAKGAYTVEADLAVLEAPGWLLDLLRHRQPAADQQPQQLYQPRAGSVAFRAAGVLSFLLSAPEGVRNNCLHWAACRFGEMVAEGLLTEADAVGVLTDAGRGLGLPDAEMLGAYGGAGTIWSGLRTGLQFRRVTA